MAPEILDSFAPAPASPSNSNNWPSFSNEFPFSSRHPGCLPSVVQGSAAVVRGAATVSSARVGCGTVAAQTGGGVLDIFNWNQIFFGF